MREDSVEIEVTEKQDSLEEAIVFVNRCAKVVKGGKRISFSAIVVAGDKSGKVGYGFGKANEASEAIRKASIAARKNMFNVPLKGSTIPHEVIGKCDGAVVLLKPAVRGTGVIVGGGARAVLELAGIKDVIGKSLKSNNRISVVKATVNALKKLRAEEEIISLRFGTQNEEVKL